MAAHKVGKKDAATAFLEARKATDFPAMMAALRRYAAKTDDRQWCNPSTWLNQHRWLDQPAAQPNARAGPRSNGWSDMLDEIADRHGCGNDESGNLGISPNGRGGSSDKPSGGPLVEILEPDRAGRWPLANRG